MTGRSLTYPCRFKKREDGSYFIRFPDLPEAMADGIDEADAHRSAEKCLASALFWRITNEVDIPPPSPPRRDQHLIAPGRAQALSDTIARGRRGLPALEGEDALAVLDRAASRQDNARAGQEPRNDGIVRSVAARGM